MRKHARNTITGMSKKKFVSKITGRLRKLPAVRTSEIFSKLFKRARYKNKREAIRRVGRALARFKIAQIKEIYNVLYVGEFYLKFESDNYRYYALDIDEGADEDLLRRYRTQIENFVGAHKFVRQYGFEYHSVHIDADGGKHESELFRIFSSELDYDDFFVAEDSDSSVAEAHYEHVMFYVLMDVMSRYGGEYASIKTLLLMEKK